MPHKEKIITNAYTDSEYIADTNILMTRFRTRSDVMKIIDFMPLPLGGEEEELEEEEHELYRLV